MHTGKLNIDNAYSYRLAGSCLATPWTRILHHHAAVDRSLSPTKHARIGSKSFLLLESHQHEHTSALIARESCTLLPRRLKGGRQVPFSRVVEARPREGEAETAPRAMEHLPVVDGHGQDFDDLPAVLFSGSVIWHYRLQDPISRSDFLFSFFLFRPWRVMQPDRP